MCFENYLRVVFSLLVFEKSSGNNYLENTIEAAAGDRKRTIPVDYLI